MASETQVSSIIMRSDQPIRLVRIPSESCIDIRINDVRITVFYPDDQKVPEVLLQNEREAAEYERARQFRAAFEIPFRAGR